MDELTMSDASRALSRSRPHLTARLAIPLLAVLLMLSMTSNAGATVTCPNTNPVLNENNCMGAGTNAWQISDGDPDGVNGFATQPSYNLGQSVPLKLGEWVEGNKVNLTVYRMGYYEGKGGRLVYTANNLTINNRLACNDMSSIGEVDCNNWEVTATIPGSALPASGVYIAKVVDTKNGFDNQILFVVRNDSSTSKVLVKIPTATYQAYNFWGGKSLYDNESLGEERIPGHPRALAVSFERPLQDVHSQANYFLHDEYALVFWMERQGYDLSYTDSTGVAEQPKLLLNHQVLVIGGHDEYWSGPEVAAVKAARDAGVSIASFSANTAYWKIRYTDNFQTIVCYKTVQDGSLGENDPGPESPTTTFRDPGAAAGSPNAPPGGRLGPNNPENSLWGNMYVGDNDSISYPLVIPPADSQGDYAGARIWRNTGVKASAGATIGSKLVGWEWDAVPTQASYLSFQPAGVKTLTASPTTGSNPEWLQDAGLTYGPNPPAGQPGVSQAVEYRAASGALVFASGTMQWPWGLGPHFIDSPGSGQSYFEAPTNTEEPVIEQATYNILSDMGVQPATPVGIKLDSGNGVIASFVASPASVAAGGSIKFDASSSSSPNGAIKDYAWDFDGSASYSTDSGSTPTVSHTFSTPGTYTVDLRVTDGSGASATEHQTVTVRAAATTYERAVEGTTGVSHFWSMGEAAGGSSFADLVGSSTAQVTGPVTLGSPGGLVGESNTSAFFSGLSTAASANIDLSSGGKLTIEMWLNWASYANDDRLALELTPNFNSNAGGFLVDPDATNGSGPGGFAVAIGEGASRNTVYFERPSAGQWHYYAFAIDTSAAAANEITPYVDGQAVPFTKTVSGTGAGNFANSSLYWMSRDASSLFGTGSMQDLALYNTTLPLGTIENHYETGSGKSVLVTPPGPTASFTSAPVSVRAGGTIKFDASASSSPKRTITDYAWDFDGSASYSTDSGASATVSHVFSTPGSYKVDLRVTDSAGATATTSHTVTIRSTPTAYEQTVQGTVGVSHFWPMNEAAGDTGFADLVGESAAQINGNVTLGSPGGLTGDPSTSALFGGSGAAQANVDLSSTGKLTIEFWLNWSAYAEDDKLALEFTPNFNEHPGGFLVDPDATRAGGAGGFAASIGEGASRNTVYFERPSARQWHYYAFAIDTSAGGESEITPYVDGRAVSYFKTVSGTGAGNFANSTLYWMSRNASSLLGVGSMQDLALYNTTLSPRVVAGHYETGSGRPPTPPTPSFSASPPSVGSGGTVKLDASGSSSLNGAITDYAWDFDGSASYSTDAGSSAAISHTFTTPGTYTVDLRVTDSAGATATTSHTVTVRPAPTAYEHAVEATTGVSHFWTLGEAAGGTGFADLVGGSGAQLAGNVTLGAPGGLAGPSNKSALFGGSGAADANVDLSSGGKLTVEMWLNWSAYAEDDKLALEFTPNFNEHPGGFLVDPDATNGSGPGAFAVAIGEGASRNTVYFERPSAGQWHYYAFAIDTSAGAESEITPYVDGHAVPFSATVTGTGAGNFANSTLYLMSRNASNLFGTGSMQDLALYNTTLSPTTIKSHYETGSSGSSEEPESPLPPDTTAPSGGELTVNGATASASGSSSFSTTGTFKIDKRTDYSEEQTAQQSGLASSVLTMVSAPLHANECGSFGTIPTVITASPEQVQPSGCYRYTLTGVDNAGNSASVRSTVMVDTTRPETPSLSFSALSPSAYFNGTTNTLYFRATSSGLFTISASSLDADTGIASYTFSSLLANGFTGTQTGNQELYSFGSSATAPSSPPTVTASNGAGASSAPASYNIVADGSAPTGGELTVNGAAATAAGASSFNATGSFTIAKRTDYSADTGSGVSSSTLTRASGTLSGNTCSNFGVPTSLTGSPSQSGLTEGCYLFVLSGVDRVGNTASISSTVKVDRTAPTSTTNVPAATNGAVAVTFSGADAGTGVNSTNGQLKRASATLTALNNTCGAYSAFANIGSVGPASPFSDTTVSTGHCYEYEYTVADLAGNSTTSAPKAVDVNTTKPSLTAATDTTPGSTVGLPQVGDALTLQFSDPIQASSVPASVTLTYARTLLGSTTVTVSGLGSGSWSTGEPLASRYSNVGGTSAVVTASTTVSGSTVKLTVTSISDPSHNLTAGGPGAVGGTLSASIKDVFGNTASTTAFKTASIRLF
jgi:PKD repeat protein